MTLAETPQDWVIRGGIVTPEQLANGARPLHGEPGRCEISAAFQPGRTVTELADFARFPHPHISVARRGALIAAGAIEIRQTPGRNPVHADIIVACSQERDPDRVLLEAIAGTFTVERNPHRGPGRR